MHIEKIILDQGFDVICRDIKVFFAQGVKYYIFYNLQDGNSLNKEKIFKLIYVLGKYYPEIVYKFYNVPFCVFKKL